MILLLLWAAAPVPPLALRLEVTVEGKSPEVAWAAFLDDLFAFHDRDGDGVLSPAESARVVPLPLLGGKTLSFSGRLTRAEFRERCRAGGFGPVVVVVEGPSADDVRLGEVFARLTRDRLRSLDADEDEYWTEAELLAASGPARAGTAGVVVGRGTPLKIDLTPAGGRSVVTVGDTRVLSRSRRALPDMRSAGGFLRAQFSVFVGESAALSRADADDDPTLTGLKGLFAHADRDGDGRLTLAELDAYLKLVERGVAAQAWVTVRDRGRNPFPLLDADGDGRLSLVELKALDGLPRQIEVSASGPATRLWGGVGVPAVPAARPAERPAARGPAWFRAMDINGDGVVSRREWLGPPALFAKLDKDGDGLLTPEEAVGE